MFHLSLRASFSLAASSFFQSSYLAQALKCQLVAAISPLLLRDKDRAEIANPSAIGGHVEKIHGGKIRARLFQRANGARSMAASFTRMRTRSTCDRWRTISA